MTPKLIGEATPEAESAFADLVTAYVADCERAKLTASKVKDLVDQNYSNMRVSGSGRIGYYPYLFLLYPKEAPTIVLAVSSALGRDDVERMDLWAKEELEERQIRRTGFRLGIGTESVFLFEAVMGHVA